MYLEVARRLPRRGTLDLANVLQQLNGRRLVGFNKPLCDNSIIGLSVAGAAECHTPAEVLSAFLAIVKAAAERSPKMSKMSIATLEALHGGRVPPVMVNESDFTDQSGLCGSKSSRLLQLVRLLLRSEDLGLVNISEPDANGHWSASFDAVKISFSARSATRDFQLFSEIRFDEVVEDLDDYVSHRRGHSMLFEFTEDEERKALLITNPGMLADVLLEWIYFKAAEGVTNVVSCEQFRPDIDALIIDDVLRRLKSEGRLRLAVDDSTQGLPHVMLTEDGAAYVEENLKEWNNRVRRDRASRNALLAFAYESAENAGVIYLPRDFLRSPLSAVAGHFFSPTDVLAASRYLQDKELARGDESKITRLTARGYDCVEQGGDVAEYSHRSDGSVTNITISDPQGVIINSPNSVQQNIKAGIDTRDLLKFAGFVRQIGSTLGLDTDKQTELEDQAMELYEVASSQAPEAGRLRRLADKILRILNAAAPTVASQTAIELGDKALRALGV
jgi:hypothetical protein